MTQSWTWKVGRTLALAGIALFYATTHAPKAQACEGCYIDGPYNYCAYVAQGSFNCEIEVDGGCTLIGDGCVLPVD